MTDDVTHVREILAALGTLSDDSLATSLTKAIRGFLRKQPDATIDETKRFLSELRDLAVYSGGASQFVMTVFWSFLGNDRNYPPPDMSKIGEWLAQWD